MAQAINFKTNQITSPVWAADFLSRDNLIPGPIKLDPTAFIAADGARVNLTAAASAAATSIAFSALGNPVPSGTLLNFGVGKYARTTADAAIGATTVAVEALPAALLITDKAIYVGAKKKIVQSGVYVGRTFAERESNLPFGPVASGDQERFLIAFDVSDVDLDPTAVAVRPNTVVKENFLPEYAAISADATLLGYLRADYRTTKGVA